MDEDNIITLNDENGNEVEFEFLDLIPYRQNEYVVLLPIGVADFMSCHGTALMSCR